MWAATGRWWIYPLLWWLPWMTEWRVINRLRSIAEHGGMERSPDRRATTHNVRQSLLARFWIVPYNTGWHLAHHVDMGVPWRNLPAYHAELERAGYITDAITYKSYWALWKALSSADEATEVRPPPPEAAEPAAVAPIGRVRVGERHSASRRLRGPREPHERPGAQPLHRGLGRARCRASPGRAPSSCISAHWYTNATAVTAMATPRTIHDFFGFPDRLFAVEYPCPGAPDVAAEVAEVAAPRWVGLDHDSWGIDHGTWSVLTHVYPDADVPVVQLAINALQPLDYHLDLATRLAPLRAQGVLIVASGNVVHNLGLIELGAPATRVRLGAALRRGGPRASSSTPPATCSSWSEHPDYPLAVPTPDHFIPLVYFAGLAAAGGRAGPRCSSTGTPTGRCR